MIFKENIFKLLNYSTFRSFSTCGVISVNKICVTNPEPVIPEKLKFSELIRSDEDEAKIENIISEYEIARNAKRRVPSYLDTEHMEELLTLPSKNQRKKYLQFLYKVEGHKISDARKKVQREENRRNRTVVDNDHIKYGFPYNTLFINVKKSHLNKLYDRRCANRFLYNQDIVIDLDYDMYMRKWESKNCAFQLCEINCYNRRHMDPFNLYFCNADRSKMTVQYLEKRLPHIWNDDNFITCSSSSYLDIFPPEKLIYLSPHAEEVMKSYDHEAVYIIGGFVDKTNKVPASIEKAKRDGIRSCRLPLDEHVEWKAGTKSLTLDQVVNILLEMKVSNDWKKAFRFLPQRKVTQRSLIEEDEI